MNQKHEITVSEAQEKLLILISHKEAKDIANSLKSVFNMALFESNIPIDSKLKDDLFIVNKLIDISTEIAEN